MPSNSKDKKVFKKSLEKFFADRYKEKLDSVVHLLSPGVHERRVKSRGW